MNNDEVVLSRFVVNKVLEVAQVCVDESRKGWRVEMSAFNDAMDSLNIPANEVRAALVYLEARTFIITFLGEDGCLSGICVVPPRYRCGFCGMWLNTRDNPKHHIEPCERQQRKIEMYRRPVQRGVAGE
jgi:hypothetical protein